MLTVTNHRSRNVLATYEATLPRDCRIDHPEGLNYTRTVDVVLPAIRLGAAILRAQRREYRPGRMCPSCARPVDYRGSHCDACFDAALAALG